MDSTSLRLTLVLIGLAILGLIWFLHKPEGRGRSPGAVRRDAPKRREPSVVEDSTPPADPDGAASEPRQTQLPDLGSEAPEWSAESARRSDAARLREAAEPRPEEELGSPTQPTASETRVEPRLESTVAAEDRVEPRWPGDDGPEASGRPSGGVRNVAGGDAPKVVTLYLRARGDRLISGLTLLDSAIKAGLRFGEMKIFHRRHQGAGKPVFSMANITRPGSFDPSAWNLFETPGVTLFLTLPGPVSALDAWDAMLATGQRLSELLEADLMDDAQCLLTRQRISQIREEMREFDRKAGIGT